MRSAPRTTWQGEILVSRTKTAAPWIHVTPNDPALEFHNAARNGLDTHLIRPEVSHVGGGLVSIGLEKSRTLAAPTMRKTNRGASLIRNRPSQHRALGMVLLQGPRVVRFLV